MKAFEQRTPTNLPEVFVAEVGSNDQLLENRRSGLTTFWQKSNNGKVGIKQVAGGKIVEAPTSGNDQQSSAYGR